MPADLIPIAANAAIALTLLGLAFTLRGYTINGPRHHTGHVRQVPAGWTPYDSRTRRAIRQYAAATRDPYVNTVNTGAIR